MVKIYDGNTFCFQQWQIQWLAYPITVLCLYLLSHMEKYSNAPDKIRELYYAGLTDVNRLFQRIHDQYLFPVIWKSDHPVHAEKDNRRPI